MRSLKFLLTVFIAVIFTSCQSNKEKINRAQPAFGEYIFAYTSGVISAIDPIYIQLAQPYNGPMQNQDVLPDNLLTFEPKIKGKTIWHDASTLKFIPDGNLSGNTLFVGKMNLSVLFEVPKNLKTFEFSFQTYKQNIKVYPAGMHTPNPSSMESVQLNGKIFTADYMEQSLMENSLEATQNGVIKKIKLVAESNKKYDFTIEDLTRGGTESEVIIKWKLGEKKDEVAGETRFVIPALGDFKVINTKVISGAAQELIVNFSDPLEQTKPDGFVKLEGDPKLKFLIDGNNLHIYPQSRILGSKELIISSSIKNAAKYPMRTTYIETITFEIEKPQVRLLADKSIIPTQEQGLLFPFEATSLKGVDVYITKIFSNNILRYLQESNFGDVPYYRNRIGRHIYRKHIDLNEMGATDIYSWNRYHIDLAEIINIDPGAIYEIDIRFKQNDAVYSCGDSKDSDSPALQSKNQGWISDGTYFVDDYWADYVYNWEEEDNPCHPAYYSSWNTSKKRVVMATNLGIIAKMGGDNQLFVAVSDMRSSKPFQAASIQVYDYQLQLMGKTLTDENGFANLTCAREPFVVVASTTNDKTYLKILQYNNLSVSKFDVAGQNVQDGIKGFIYGERGVWRPGDSLYVNFVLDDPNEVLPKSHPVEMKLYNPQGQLVQRMVKTSGVNGFYDFRTATKSDAITGDYLMDVSLGNRTYSKYLKIETVKPNRLKVDLEVDEQATTDRLLTAHIESKWLHGADASNLKADVFMALRGTKTEFKGFENYHFDNHIRDAIQTEDIEVFNGSLNSSGMATFKIPMGEKTKNAPGMVKVLFSSKVYEPGGNFSVDYHSVNYAPYTSFAGMELPESNMWGNALETDKEHQIKLVSVDKNGKLTQHEKLWVKVYKINNRWWYDQYNGSHYNYLNSSHYRKIIDREVSLTQGRGVFEVNIDKQNWGSYLIHVEDPVSGHSSARFVFFDWPYWMQANRAESDAASILGFSSDKTSYDTGDSIKITFPSPKNGRALISIENGTKILQKKWVKTESGVTQYALKATPEMAPNVFVHISLIQPHIQTQNDRPMRMYGIIPILVENPDSRLHPEIKAPDVLKPETTTKISVSEKSGKPMTYTVAVVDEGLLALTRFKTPNPWNSFYAREALGVKTWDMYNEVVGALNSDFQSVLSVGGDEEAIEPGKQKANRFTPVVKFLGPFSLEKGKTANHEIEIPNYIGAVRVMVVAGQKSAYGSTEKEIPVKNPIMVLGTLPRVLGPDEKVSLPVNVFAMEPKIKNVTVSIESNDILKIDGEKNKTISFQKPGDDIVYFNLSTTRKTGVGKVKIVARSGSEVSKYEVELDVRPSNPTYTTIRDTLIPPSGTWNANYAYFGLDGTNKGVVELSKLPALNLEKRLDFLISYPHGCLEQITSGAFPQIYLDKMTDLSANQKGEIDRNIQYVLNAFRNYQLPHGGLSYWPGSQAQNNWSSSYAGHFMLEAEKQGYALPLGIKRQWIRNQQSTARNYNSDNNRDLPYKQRDQAYRLYTLALASQPDYGSMNVLLESNNLDYSARWILALAYITAGQPEVATDLVNGLTPNIQEYTELSYTFGSSLRDKAFVLETLLALDKNTDAARLAYEMAHEVGSNKWLSTQALAFSLKSLALYMGDNKGEVLSASLTANGKSKEINTSKNLIQESLSADANSSEVVITNKSNQNLYARLILSGKPVEGKEKRMAKDIQMEIKYMDANHNQINVENLKQGAHIIAEVTVLNPGSRGNYFNLALTQIFPSGWEILNPRMSDTEWTQGKIPTYQDIRDDRVMSYFDLSSKEKITLRMQLNASYSGKYYMPAIVVNAMYDESIIAVEPGRWVEIKP